jgi:hypothetical protein
MACVSCPPRPIVPSGGVEIQTDKALGTSKTIRYMSADGSRVFFQTPDQLVGGDVNGEPNVYEWEDGRDYLISGGNSHVPSRYLDSSESGGDVFFATEQGLVPSDNDEMNDVYDARIPRPGDNPPPEKTPCSGAVCQGPPSVPELLTPAASATFEGLGNIPAAVVAPEKETKPAVKCKKGYVKRSGRCVKRKKKKRKANAKKGRRARKSAAGERRAK